MDEHWDRGYREGADATFVLWLGVMFSGQIFADFAGYSTIAQGLGYLLGYRFPENFKAPYLAATFKNFWERWHITLSRWLRDYLYVPLGGNRGSRGRTLLNLLLVMLLGGLWHGAAYTFIVWGAIHGLCLVGERVLGLHAATRPHAGAVRQNRCRQVLSVTAQLSKSRAQRSIAAAVSCAGSATNPATIRASSQPVCQSASARA